MCVCRLGYPACNAHAPYCHLWPIRLYYIFFTSQKWLDFRKEVTEHKMCDFIFSTTFVWKISHSKKKWESYNHKCTLVFMHSIRYSCQISMKLDRFSTNTQIEKFHKSPSRGSRVVPHRRADRRRDRQTDTTKLIVAFSNFANSPKNGVINYKCATAENVHIMYCFTTT
jgi:hypothetical protein